MLDATNKAVGRRWVGAIALLAAVCAVAGSAELADAEDTPTVSINDAEPATEGNPVSFVITLSAAAAADVTVTAETSGGSGYTPRSEVVTIPAGQTSVPFDVATQANTLDEHDRTFQVTLREPSNATLGDAVGGGTIMDDDDPPTVSPIVNIEVVEDTVVRTLDVSLSAPSGKVVTIDYQLGEAGTATRGADFTFSDGKLTLEPGVTTRSIPVSILEDTLAEGDESIVVNLFGHENVQPGDIDAQVTIKDDGDPAAAPTVSNASVTEGNAVEGEPTTDLVFEVSLRGPRARTTFTYRTVAGSADGSDYVEVGGAPVILPASSAAAPEPVRVTIKVKRDTLDEIDETFTFQLVDPSTDAVVATAAGTIVNDDNNSVLTVADTHANEPTSGTSTMTFTISLAPASGRSVTLAWATADGTATAGADYEAARGAVSFAPGETSKTVQVTVLGEGVNEDNETLKVVLSAPEGANVTDAEAVGTIVDKNAPPSLSISDTTGREGEGATFTVTLIGTTLRTVSVRFDTGDGLAKAGSDYVARVGSLTFAPGERSKSIAVTVIDDDASEPSEDFVISLGDPVNAIITKSVGRAIIEASDRVATAPTPAEPTRPVATPAGTKTPAKVLTPRIVLGPRTLAVGANGVARMLVTCQKASPITCRGTVELQRAARPLLKLGSKTFAVRKGKKQYASIKLTSRALALLRRNGTMRAKVVVTVKTTGKNLTVSPGIVTLTAPKPTTNRKSTPKVEAGL